MSVCSSCVTKLALAFYYHICILECSLYVHKRFASPRLRTICTALAMRVFVVRSVLLYHIAPSEGAGRILGIRPLPAVWRGDLGV